MYKGYTQIYMAVETVFDRRMHAKWMFDRKNLRLKREREEKKQRKRLLSLTDEGNIYL